MVLSADLAFWLFQAKVWIILGLVLVIADVFLGTLVLLPVGIAAFLVGGLIIIQRQLWFGDFVFFENWRDIMVYFAVLSVLSTLAMRFWFKRHRSDQPDINEY